MSSKWTIRKEGKLWKITTPRMSHPEGFEIGSTSWTEVTHEHALWVACMDIRLHLTQEWKPC